MTDKPNREWLKKMAELEDQSESVAAGAEPQCELCGDTGTVEPEWGDPVFDRPYSCPRCPAGLIPGLRRAIGDVLVQWDLVPNDIKCDPGTNAIAAAIGELEIAWQSVCGISLHPDQGDPRPPNPSRPEQQREGA